MYNTHKLKKHVFFNAFDQHIYSVVPMPDKVIRDLQTVAQFPMCYLLLDTHTLDLQTVVISTSQSRRLRCSEATKVP